MTCGCDVCWVNIICMAREMLRTGTSYSHDLFLYIVHEKFKLVYQKKKKSNCM